MKSCRLQGLCGCAEHPVFTPSKVFGFNRGFNCKQVNICGAHIPFNVSTGCAVSRPNGQPPFCSIFEGKLNSLKNGIFQQNPGALALKNPCDRRNGAIVQPRHHSFPVAVAPSTSTSSMATHTITPSLSLSCTTTLAATAATLKF